MANIFAETIIEVPFHDVDVMEVVWHGHYVKYFEVARTALLRLIDFDYPQMRETGYVWPVVECYLKYVRPARYGQRLLLRARLGEYENRLKISYEIFCAASGERLTKGYTVQVAVDKKTGDLQFISPFCLIQKVQALCVS